MNIDMTEVLSIIPRSIFSLLTLFLVTKLIGERSLLEEMLLSAKEFFNSMEE